jgi:hypothetical protein
VEDIRPIQWSDQPFASLTIPTQKKEVIMAVAQNRLDRSESDGRSDDTAHILGHIVEGKGRGVNILLL